LVDYDLRIRSTAVLPPYSTNNQDHCIYISTMRNELPSISQRTPVNPTGHEQTNDDPLFEQVPPLKHGPLAHGVPLLDQHIK
jgi:hypothetical protein